ncbi:reverse transcriptase domain-containing protein [Tanacetum coccineum]
MITNQVLTKSTTRVSPLVVQPSLASTSSEIPPAPVPSPLVPEQNPHQPLIPYPSRLNKEKLQDKVDIQIHSFLQMFKKIYFNISFAKALAHMPKFAVLLKKLPEKLRDTRRFLIPCDFYGLESCMALTDLGASINLMPLSVWKTLSLPKLTPTRMTLELATRTVAYPADHFHEVLNVQKSINPMSSSPTPSSDPVVESLSHSLTPFRDSDFLLEETDTFLSLDDSIPPGIDNGIYDSEGDIILLEELLNDDPTPNLPPPLPVYEISETEKIKTSIDDPPYLELKDLPPHLEYAFLEGTSKLPVIIAKDLKREENEQLLKMLERLAGNEFYCFLDGFSGYFKIPIDPQDQDKTTFTCPYGTFAYRRMPFGLCNAPRTFQRCMVAIFHDMIEKTIETIVYTNHSALKYPFAKQDAKTRLLQWILLLQEFNIEIHDKKGAEDLAADHLSRLENHHQGDLVDIEMNDNFPHESLNMISLNPDNEPPWFADIANYLVGNVLIKGMSSQ